MAPLKKRDGSIGMAVLVAALAAAAAAQTLLYLAQSELAAANTNYLQRQTRVVANELLQAALTDEADGALISDVVLPPQVWYPGKAELQARLFVSRDEALGVRKFTVWAEAGAEQTGLEELRAAVPAEIASRIGSATVSAGGVLTAAAEALADLAYASDAGALPLSFDAEKYKEWSNLAFLDPEGYQKTGFGNRLYYSAKSSGDREIKVTSGSETKIINGRAWLVAEKTIKVSDELVLTGRVALISNGDIVLGSGVRLEQALLIAKGKIKLGGDCRVSGILLSGGDIEFGANCRVTRNEDALLPLLSAVYLAPKRV